jgi:general secretion pathway protein E/type IV pilus assembly protein PilB
MTVALHTHLASSPSDLSSSLPWLRLQSKQITCEEAIALLVQPSGAVNFDQLSDEVASRFFRSFPSRKDLPPVIPLLLWQGCYYLGSPIELDPQTISNLSDRTSTSIEVVRISSRSYRSWYSVHSPSLGVPLSRVLTQPLSQPPDSLVFAGTESSVLPSDPFSDSSSGLSSDEEADNIAEVTELSLKRADTQIARIKTILERAVGYGASDVHLEPTTEGLRVRYRIDGILRDITVMSHLESRRAVAALKVMADLDISESRRPQDGRIGDSYALNTESSGGFGVDMRLSTLPCVGGEKAVIRLLPRKNPFNGLEDLGFSARNLEVYKHWLGQPQGTIIITGPTGSGKTSTLYNSLQAIATEDVNVVTVEDPVEYVLPRITQTSVHEVAGMTFAAGIRAILRQDPDILMVGEIRDVETATAASRASLTGHLVLTTLHTPDALGAIPRLKDLGLDLGLISESVLGIVAQRLVRKVCPYCSVPCRPTSDDLQRLNLSIQDASSDGWRRGVGCSHCFNSGYQGREAVVELLSFDSKVRDFVYTGNLSLLRDYLANGTFESFRKGAIDKLTRGVTTIDEIFRVLPYNAFS